MDDIGWADEALSSILQLCAIQIEINVELWIVIDGIPSPNPAVIDGLCPGLCSGHGTCIERKYDVECQPQTLQSLTVCVPFLVVV